jgi:hypothetical protein
MPEADGVTLSPEKLFNLARDAGFDPLEAKNAVAIALVESNGETRAFNPKGPNGGAIGVWQIAGPTKAWLIENVDGFDSEEDLYIPEKNAEAAYIMAHHLNGWSEPLEKADWGDWRTSLANSENFTMWHPRDDNEETAMAAATRAFHSWAGDDSDALYPEDVGGFGEPGSDASTTSADTLRSQIVDPVPYRERVMQAMKDKNTPKVVPLQMEMSGQEFSALQRSTQDPGMRAALSRHADNFRTGDAGFVGYETDEAASTATKWLRIYGLGADSQFPFIVYNLGKQAIDKTGDIASQLWDKAIGSLWGGGDDSNRIEGESGLEGKSNYE